MKIPKKLFLWIGFLAVKILMIEDLSGKNIFITSKIIFENSMEKDLA